MKNMYEEMSHGAYTVHGSATPWVTVPHSEAYYGASTCFLNEDGVYEAGAIQDMQGHPDNPLGAGQLPIDAVTALAAAQPDSRGPTTTSRTRATATATATSSSPTA